MSQLGEHIRRLREIYGFDLAKLARLSGIPISRVKEIESGTPLSTAELARLADALAVDPASVHAGKIEEIRRTVARFRAPTGLSDINGSDARLLARAAEAGEICGELRTLLGEGSSPIIGLRKPVAVAASDEPWRQDYELGRSARETLFSTHGPLQSVQGSLEELGAHVAFVHFEANEIEAASLLEPGASPVILLNKSSSRVKYPLSRRAILAHELCHLLHDGGQRDLTIISREEGLDTSVIERRANGFAPNFLAPREWVSSHSKSAKRVVTEIAEHWGLSLEGAAWHAKNLGLIDESRVEQFRREALRPGFETRFEPDIPRTPPDLVGIEVKPTDLVSGYLSELAIVAAEEGAISKGRAAGNTVVTMTVWILDDGPFGILAKHYNPRWSWPARTLHTVAEVASAALLDRSGRRNSLLAMQQGGEPVIEVHSIMAGSPAAVFFFAYLRPIASSATNDLGEHAAISYCALERTDASFVTMDKGAAFLALAELGTGRVATPFDLWDDLQTKRLVTLAEFSSLCDAVHKSLALPGVPQRIRR